MEKKKKILIIDDNMYIYDSLICALREDNHYDICTALNIRHAKSLLIRNHFDLAIIDIMMPSWGMELKYRDEYCTGLNFYHSYIRNKYPNMIIIFWSALSQDALDEYFCEKGGIPKNVFYYLKNSYSERGLIEFINNILFPKKNK